MRRAARPANRIIGRPVTHCQAPAYPVNLFNKTVPPVGLKGNAVDRMIGRKPRLSPQL